MFRNGQNVNLAMVSSGQAFAYQKYLAACDGFAYLAAEAAAQRQRIGVWAVPGGIQRPWDWRHGTRRPGQAAAPLYGAIGHCWQLRGPEADLPGHR
jgi:endonuclease YncB( thermonuclease family)